SCVPPREPTITMLVVGSFAVATGAILTDRPDPAMLYSNRTGPYACEAGEGWRERLDWAPDRDALVPQADRVGGTPGAVRAGGPTRAVVRPRARDPSRPGSDRGRHARVRSRQCTDAEIRRTGRSRLRDLRIDPARRDGDAIGAAGAAVAGRARRCPAGARRSLPPRGIAAASVPRPRPARRLSPIAGGLRVDRRDPHLAALTRAELCGSGARTLIKTSRTSPDARQSKTRGRSALIIPGAAAG